MNFLEQNNVASTKDILKQKHNYAASVVPELRFLRYSNGENVSQSNWKKFLDGKLDSTALTQLDPILLNSWTRSLEAQVDPLDGKPNSFRSPEGDKADVIVDISRRIADFIYPSTIANHMMVSLTDADGYLVHCYGSKEIIKEAARINFGEDSNWGENSVGTNAIGTALNIGSPIQIFGSEHFCESHHQWRCTASPFRTPFGTVAGCFDISSNLNSCHDIARKLVSQAVYYFENSLLYYFGPKLSLWVETFFPREIGSENQGHLVANASGFICGWDAQAKDALRLSNSALSGTSMYDLFDFHKGSPSSHLDMSCFLASPGFRPGLMAKAVPIPASTGGLLGFVLQVVDISASSSSLGKGSAYTARKSADVHTSKESAIIGMSPATKKIREQVEAFAQTPSTVFITGPSGAGKELVARQLHQLGPRSNGPFVPVNCGALSDSLIHSQLFGYVGGAFTGANKAGKPGYFELANNGVLFLDEICELPLEHQVNMLRVVEDGWVLRLGSTVPIPINVKLVVATNKSPEEEVAAGRFREDLFHRLNVIRIKLSPLKSRAEDIAAIATYHLIRLSNYLDIPCPRLGQSALDAIMRHELPGNVRSVVNALEYALNQYFITPFRELGVEHLPPDYAMSCRAELCAPEAQQEPGGTLLQDATKMAIVQALELHKWNVSRAAKHLGIGRTTLYAKMRDYNIQR